MGCGPVGGLPAFDPFFQAPAPYYPKPRPAPRPIAVQQPKPMPKPTPVAALPAPDFGPTEPVTAARPVEVPSPEQLGIALPEPAVAVPAPEQLGIRLD